MNITLQNRRGFPFRTTKSPFPMAMCYFPMAMRQKCLCLAVFWPCWKAAFRECVEILHSRSHFWASSEARCSSAKTSKNIGTLAQGHFKGRPVHPEGKSSAIFARFLDGKIDGKKHRGFPFQIESAYICGVFLMFMRCLLASLWYAENAIKIVLIAHLQGIEPSIFQLRSCLLKWLQTTNVA